MRFSRLERKLVVGGILTAVLLAAAGGSLLLWLARAGWFVTHPGALPVIVVVFLLVQTFALAGVAAVAGRSIARRLQAIQLDTELIATVNPDHRLALRTDDEMQSLAEEINRLADRLQQARSGLESEVAHATRGLALEREKLSAVLRSLGEGVIVATPEGQVSLANAVAQELLGAGGASLLGRSLFELVDRETLVHFIDRLTTGGGVQRFTLQLPTGVVLATAMTPFFDGQGGTIGVILVLRDVTRPARFDEERQRLFASTLMELRGPLATVRSLSESLLNAAGLGADTVTRMLGAIHTEAVRLSRLVKETGAAEQLGVARPPWHFETISIPDLVAMTSRRLAQAGRGSPSIELEGDPAGLPPLRAEVAALSVALAHLLGLLHAGSEGGRAWLRPSLRGGVLQLEARVQGRMELDALEKSLDMPVTAGAHGRLTARDIVRRHAGEVWPYIDGARYGFRLTVPVDTSPPLGEEPPATARFVGAGTVSGVADREARGERPDFYDFSLFEQMERALPAADRQRPLEELTCVVFDTETTGLDIEHDDRVVSIAGVRVRDAVVKRGEIFDALVHPGRAIPPESVRFHGITDAMVAEAPPIDVVLPAFLRFADGGVLVGHQVWFDLTVLARDLRRLGRQPLTATHPVLDTLLLSQIVHGPLRRHGLDTLAERFGVGLQGRHSALGDALATAEILVNLIPLLKKRGIVTLGDAIGASRRARDASAR